MFRWSLVYTVLMVASFVVGARYGVTGVAAAYCVAYFIFAFYPGFAIPFRLIDLKFSDFARSLWPQTAITMTMAAVCGCWLIFLNRTGIINPWIQLISTVLIGIVVYIALMIRLRPQVIVMEETFCYSRMPPGSSVDYAFWVCFLQPNNRAGCRRPHREAPLPGLLCAARQSALAGQLEAYRRAEIVYLKAI